MPAPDPASAAFAPELPDAAAEAWEALADALCAARGAPARLDLIEASLPARIGAVPEGARLRLRTAALVALDLARQGWGFQRRGGLQISPPGREADPSTEKARVRAQLHVERDRQLDEPAVRDFVRRMETRRVHRGRWRSVFDLMRDGRALATALREANQLEPAARQAALEGLIQPYLQVVDERGRCAHTGLALRDIWRYFRHTWATPYRSVPGRGLNLLVRDAAAPDHPVIGVAMLTSAPAQISCRDAWIGWQPDDVIQRLRTEPTARHAAWLAGELRRGLDEIYVQDLLEDGMITPAELREPTPATLTRLRAESRLARESHARFARSQDHKREVTEDVLDEAGWEQRARSPLFRSKRAALLADLLDARGTVQEQLGDPPDATGLAALLSTEGGRRAARIVTRRAKADRMGVALAEISVCGAIAPYNELLGGKLVALLMASPEVQAIYAERYGGSASLIASSMAGRPIVRGARLCLLTTSSLFHVASAQYNRLSAPAEALGGRAGLALRYRELGLTAGFGTSQFSGEAVDALVRLYGQEREGHRVNSIFGEGVNPRLRKVREGLDILGLPSDLLLVHGSPRRVYGVSLVENLTDSLLGADEPAPIIPEADPKRGSEALIGWWRTRWLDGRARRDEVLARVEGHRLDHPIRHGGRVPSPEAERRDEPAGAEARQLSLLPLVGGARSLAPP